MNHKPVSPTEWKTYVDARRAAESREAILGSALLKRGGPGDAA